jgi:thiol-disulfide isomerase/thioredoxin
VSTRRGVLAGAAAGLFAAAGCASPARPAPAPAAAVPAALAFTGRTVGGAAFDAATLAGRPALLWFWAPWCATCASQASSVTDLQTRYGARLGIVAVGGMGDARAMREFIADLDTGRLTNLDDQAGVVWRRFAVTEQSDYVLIDRTGTVRSTGFLDDVDLAARVSALVA